MSSKQTQMQIQSPESNEDVLIMEEEYKFDEDKQDQPTKTKRGPQTPESPSRKKPKTVTIQHVHAKVIPILTYTNHKTGENKPMVFTHFKHTMVKTQFHSKKHIQELALKAWDYIQLQEPIIMLTKLTTMSLEELRIAYRNTYGDIIVLAIPMNDWYPRTIIKDIQFSNEQIPVATLEITMTMKHLYPRHDPTISGIRKPQPVPTVVAKPTGSNQGTQTHLSKVYNPIMDSIYFGSSTIMNFRKTNEQRLELISEKPKNSKIQKKKENTELLS